MRFVPKNYRIIQITANKINYSHSPQNILLFVAFCRCTRTSVHVQYIRSYFLIQNFLICSYLHLHTYPNKKQEKHKNNENTKSSSWTTAPMFILFTTLSHETAREWEILLNKRNWNYNKSTRKNFLLPLSVKMVKRNVQVGNFKSYKLKCECSWITVPSTPLHMTNPKKTFPFHWTSMLLVVTWAQ